VLEHALTRAHLEDAIAPLELIGASIVPRTTADRVIWAALRTLLGADAATNVADTIALLLAVVCRPLEDDDLLADVRRELTVIEAERLHRRNDLDYRLQRTLAPALYGDHPLGRDMLPRPPTDPAIADTRPALETLRSNVRMVTVVGPGVTKYADIVEARAVALLATAHAPRWRAHAEPPPVVDRDDAVVLLNDDAAAASRYGVALLSLRLTPFRAFPRHERVRQVLLAEALADQVPCHATADSRHCPAKQRFSVPWADVDTARFALRDYRRTLCRRLPRGRRHLSKLVRRALMPTASQKVLRLVHRFDVHDLTPEEVEKASDGLALRDVESLASEIASARGAVAYWGPELA
jgi:hypothetical protein